MTPDPSPADAPLARGLGFWQATAVNITQIVGAGVFATVPLILGVLPGPAGLLAWIVAGLLILCDGMVWAELGAAMPSAGGSFHFLREAFGRTKWGRLMGFLFVWQLLISGPLEIGSGLVAAAQFSTALSPEFKAFDDDHTLKWEVEIAADKKIGVIVGPSRLVGLALGVLVVVLLYRRVTTLGRISMVFLIAVMAIIAWVLLEGAVRFDPAVAFAPPANPVPPEKLPSALGAGMALAIYSYLGYYNVCYLGGEVRNPARTIPRAILVSALVVVVLYPLIQLAITGVIPPDEAARSTDNLTADFMARVRGPWAATLVTVCLIGSCFASVFSGTLGYSRVPYAAAKGGEFFGWFAAVHPKHRIPHRSLLLVGGLALVWSLFSLQAVIDALIATRILEQFVAQVFAVIAIRRAKQPRPLPWRMWLYPLPCLVALFGWVFVYATTGRLFVIMGAGTLLIGAVVFFIRARVRREWPFGPPSDDRPIEQVTRD
jgi:amino acid transporter